MVYILYNIVFNVSFKYCHYFLFAFCPLLSVSENSNYTLCIYIRRKKKKRELFYFIYLSDPSFDSKLGVFRDVWNEQTTYGAAGFLR